METTRQPPRKGADKRKSPGKSGEKAEPRAPDDVTGGKDGEDSDRPSEEEVISHWRNPVTNQDEQEKITNTGGDDIPIANK